MTESLLSYLIIYFFLSAFLFVLPFLVAPTVPFGVRIPLAYIHHPEITNERRRYLLRLAGIDALLLAILFYFSLSGRMENIKVVSIVGLIAGGWGVYYLSHAGLSRVKKEQNWYANTRQTLIASVHPRSLWPSKTFWSFFALPAVVVGATVVIGWLRSPLLADTLTYHFSNQFGSWTGTTNVLALSLPALIELGILLALSFLAWVSDLSGESIDIEDPQGSQQFRSLNITLIQSLLFLLAFGLNAAVLASALQAWGITQVNLNGIDYFTLIPIAIWLVAAPILLLRHRRQFLSVSKEKSDRVSPDDDHFWKLGMIYFNPQDPSILVNKRFGIGRTLNFGNPISWVLFLALIGFIVYKVSFG
jgi:uncharacterized membrane protein